MCVFDLLYVYTQGTSVYTVSSKDFHRVCTECDSRETLGPVQSLACNCRPIHVVTTLNHAYPG